MLQFDVVILNDDDLLDIDTILDEDIILFKNIVKAPTLAELEQRIKETRSPDYVRYIHLVRNDTGIRFPILVLGVLEDVPSEIGEAIKLLTEGE